jgi:hypothetical protein
MPLCLATPIYILCVNDRGAVGGEITCLAVEGTKIYTDNRHWGISVRRMGECEKDRWARAEVVECAHFNFNLKIDQLIIDAISFFREPSTPFHHCVYT